MSSTHLDVSGAFQPWTVEGASTRLTLPSQAVHIRHSGVEFLSPTPVPAWAEMTVELHAPNTARRVRANGIVVGCHGNRHAGYVVSIVFLGLSRQARQRLADLGRTGAA